MITENKLISLYNQAKESGHPDPEGAVFGRYAMTDGKEDYDKDGRAGLFGVSKSKMQEIGLAKSTISDDQFNAMMYWDGRHLNDTPDINEAMARTAGVKDSALYRRELDAAYESFSKDNMIWEGGELIGLKNTSEIETDETFEDSASVEQVKEDSKRLVADNMAASNELVMLGVPLDPSGEFSRLEGQLKAVIKKFVET